MWHKVNQVLHRKKPFAINHSVVPRKNDIVSVAVSKPKTTLAHEDRLFGTIRKTAHIYWHYLLFWGLRTFDFPWLQITTGKKKCRHLHFGSVFPCVPELLRTQLLEWSHFRLSLGLFTSFTPQREVWTPNLFFDAFLNIWRESLGHRQNACVKI